MVGATGFEPATTSTPRRCATGLRYAPTSGVDGVRERDDPSRKRLRRQGVPGSLPRPGPRAVRAGLQEREEPFHVPPERAEHLLAVGAGERELHLFLAAAIVQELPSRARDREPVVVEELLHLEENLHVALAIHARAAPPLLGPQHLELRLPIPEDVCLDPDHVADLADGIIEPSRRNRSHAVTSSSTLVVQP